MNRTLWLVIGIISVLGGIFALFNPLSASLAAEQIAGWLFLLVGILQFVALFRTPHLGAKLYAALVGVIGILVGIELLGKPFDGVIALTLVIGILFLATGVVKAVVALQLRHAQIFLPILISALLSLILAAMIFTDFPKSATYILGILLAVELISNGISLILFARLQP